jgi:predicted short-subunit dehydrogenase-like oxidoreductase (DUF2520 family)
MKRVAVLGLGRAGGSLVASLQDAGIHVVGARRAHLLKASALRDVEALFLAVPDDAIADTARKLAPRKDLPRLVVHLAGSHGTAILDALPARVARGCFHPLASLDGERPIPPRTLLAVDASTKTATRALLALGARIGGTPRVIPSSWRVLYHASAVISANLAVALLDQGVRLLRDAGVEDALAREVLARLLRSQADNAIHKPLSRALTGPVARGDVGTVKRHVDALDARAPKLAALYRELSLILVDDVAKNAPRTKAALRDALTPRARASRRGGRGA